jgi:hypothetical protein
MEARVWRTSKNHRIEFERLEDSHLTNILNQRITTNIAIALRRINYATHSGTSLEQAVGMAVGQALNYSLRTDVIGAAMTAEMKRRGLRPSGAQVPPVFDDWDVPPELSG